MAGAAPDRRRLRHRRRAEALSGVVERRLPCRGGRGRAAGAGQGDARDGARIPSVPAPVHAHVHGRRAAASDRERPVGRLRGQRDVAARRTGRRHPRAARLASRGREAARPAPDARAAAALPREPQLDDAARRRGDPAARRGSPRVKAFVTGATGFLGGALVRALRARGDEVVALVRDPSRASALDARIVEGDLADRSRLAEQMRGCDAVFHVAAMYEVGIPRSRRPAMYDANVRGTQNAVDAAVEAGAARIVYVSTINAFGNTHGRVVDETYERRGGDYVSYYDETKHLAHLAARKRIERGAPVVIVQPGAIYGPGDHSELGAQLDQARAGKLKFLALADVGVNAVHVDDVAAGMLLAHDRGRLGEAYVLGGELTRLGEMIDVVARLAGRRPPGLTVPTPLVKLMIPLGPVVGRVMGTGPNLRELISASAGVTYWASDAKARRLLGYEPRDLAEGLVDLVEAA